ncbi:hypothetical protein KDAU_14570 [Dictyobacter aurantiacus]|uniref:Uncharacterized protein n=1 Tax=Dictyobacter aurantiacus TaxID=1936993 RepID=A0A401ZBN6_9CHLR|nr:hypothetical protein KDAU_14570 [Dictyobacter aurantiacus]
MHLQSRGRGSTGARGTEKQTQEHKKKAAQKSPGGLKHHNPAELPWQPFSLSISILRISYPCALLQNDLSGVKRDPILITFALQTITQTQDTSQKVPIRAL